ncbi:CoA pyrophosphatase [Paludibacter sp.]
MDLDKLRRRLTQPLPGLSSQLKMAPAHRAKEFQELNGDNYNPRLSAVLVLLFHENSKLKIVFIRRSEYVGMHSGQIAFPGGRYEEFDADLKITAIREAEEEIGLHPGDYELLGQLTDLYVPPSNFLVRAFLAYAQSKPKFKIDTREVQEVLVLNYDEFKKPDVVKEKEFKIHNRQELTTAPYFDVDGVVIWGATAMLMRELLDIDN